MLFAQRVRTVVTLELTGSVDELSRCDGYSKAETNGWTVASITNDWGQSRVTRRPPRR